MPLNPHVFLGEIPSGWWCSTTTPLKNDGRIVSWDDHIPKMMGKSFKIPWFQSPPTSLLFQTQAFPRSDTEASHHGSALDLLGSYAGELCTENQGIYEWNLL
jgi:hypothetical protein